MTAPKLRFKEFSEDYNFSKFQEASIQIIDGDRGNNYPKSDDFYDNEYCLFLNAGNVTKSGFKFGSTQFINKEKDALLRKGKLQKNDLVITTRGTVGNIAYFDESIPFENIRINSGMVIVRSEIDLEPIYLNQFLKSDLFEKWLEKNVFGSAQPQLTVKLLNSISISYPSKEEQTKIASFLSAVDEKISQLTQKHALLSQYKQGMMQKLFSQQIRFKADDGSEFGEWEDKSLSNFIIKHIGGASLTPSDFVEQSEYEVIPKKAIVPNGYLNLDKDNPTYCSEDFFKANLKNTVDNAYLVTVLRDLVPSGPSIGYIVKFLENNQYILAQGVYGFKLKKELNKDFLIHFSNTKAYRLVMQSIMVGSTQVHIRNKDFFGIEIPVPCLEEQTKIANFLSAIDQKIEVVAQQIEQAKVWKKGLLQQMFV